MAESRTDRFVRSQGWLEPVGDFIQKVVGAVYAPLGAPGRYLKDLLHGTRVLGHPLHPALTDVPLGAWVVGVTADLLHYPIPSLPTAVGDVGIGFGLIAGLGSAISGYTDHHETFGQERRVATLHGLLMTLVLVVMTVSVALRWKGGAGGHGLAVLLALVGVLLAVTGAYFGGHLVFGIGTMVNHNAFAVGPEETVVVGKATDFGEGMLKLVQAGDMPVLITRVSGKLYAIANTCSHAGGPLNEGSLDGDVVTCPWHSSKFCVRDGAVRGGPATFAQPALTVEEAHGQVKVKLAQPLH
ncbi:MAG TPA: Rieske 2Fe-2S domain-containing protein [Candidatus Dormibacteraeota bacterium]